MWFAEDKVNKVVATALCRRVAINNAPTRLRPTSARRAERGDYSVASPILFVTYGLQPLGVFPKLGRSWPCRSKLCISE